MFFLESGYRLEELFLCLVDLAVEVVVYISSAEYAVLDGRMHAHRNFWLVIHALIGRAVLLPHIQVRHHAELYLGEVLDGHSNDISML